jgi:hypothetical protein
MLAVAAAALAVAAVAKAAPATPPANDYPTPARADYVLGCMAANGNTHEALYQCSCAIDAIAKQIPYSDYEKAETALSLQNGNGVGGRVALFRDPPEIKAVLERLRQAQADANLSCFQ